MFYFSQVQSKTTAMARKDYDKRHYSALSEQKTVYSPNLSSCIPMKFYGAEFNASHDYLAEHPQDCHFVDEALWVEGVKLLGDVAKSQCSKLYGTHVVGGNVVIGMLKDPVKVRELESTHLSQRKRPYMRIDLIGMRDTIYSSYGVSQWLGRIICGAADQHGVEMA